MMPWAAEQMEGGINYYAICESMEMERNTLAPSDTVCENPLEVFFIFFSAWHVFNLSENVH